MVLGISKNRQETDMHRQTITSQRAVWDCVGLIVQLHLSRPNNNSHNEIEIKNK